MQSIQGDLLLNNNDLVWCAVSKAFSPVASGWSGTIVEPIMPQTAVELF